MKLTLVIGSLRHGGSERQVAHLANGLLERGHDVRLVLLQARHAQDYGLLPGVAVRELRIDRWTARPGLLRNLRREFAHADVVYSFLDLANALCALVRPARGAQLVWGLRASNRAAGRLAGISRLLCRWLRRRARGVIANSEAVLTHYRQTGVIAESMPAQVVVNGIRAEQLTPAAAAERRHAWRARLDLPQDAEVLLVLGRNAAEKRQDLALRLLALQPRTFLVCAGRGVTALAAPWASSPAMSRVRLLEHENDVAGLLHMSDLLLSCSDHEGSPNVLAEALVRTVPVIATAVGGTPELFALSGADPAPGQPQQVPGGWLVAREDVDGMQAALQAWRGGQTLAPALQAVSVEAMVQQTEAVLAGWAG